MKRTLKLALLSTLALVGCTTAMSQVTPQNLTYSALYVPATHSVAPVLGYKFTTIQNLFGTKFSPELFILGGYDPVKSHIVGGFSLQFKRAIAKNVDIEFGPAIVTATDGKPHAAATFSINIRP